MIVMVICPAPAWVINRSGRLERGPSGKTCEVPQALFYCTIAVPLAFVGVTYSPTPAGRRDRRAGEISIAAAQAQESKSAPAYLGGVTSLQALVP
jgi:hypothetical protein